MTLPVTFFACYTGTPHTALMIVSTSKIAEGTADFHGLLRIVHGLSALICGIRENPPFLSVEQTPPTPDLKRTQDDATRIDQAIGQFQKARKSLPPQVKYLAVDGWYAKIKFANNDQNSTDPPIFC